MNNYKTITQWFSMLVVLLVAGLGTAAAQSLTLGAVSIKAGQTADVAVSLAGGSVYGIQADIVLPTGLTVVDHSLQTTQAGVRVDGQTVAGGAFRVAAFSMPSEGSAVAITKGEVFTLTVQAAPDFAGGSISLKGIELTANVDGSDPIAVPDTEAPSAEVEVVTAAPEAPVANVPQGQYTEPQTVTLTCATSGAAIYYTTDGTVPTAESTPYEGAISITTSTVLKAVAIKDGTASETVTTVQYDILQPIPEGLAYYWKGYALGAKEVGGTATSTDDNSDISVSNSIYSTIRLQGKSDFSTKYVTITLDKPLVGGETIKITAYRNKDAADKKVGVLLKFAEGVTAKTGDGLEFVNINKAVSDSNSGDEPNTVEVVVPANAAGSNTITMTRHTTATNLFITQIEIEPYVAPAIVAPTFSPAGGLYVGEQTVSLSCATAGAVIYYTTDGTAPTIESTVYSEPLTISEETTVKAIAVNGDDISEVVSATYSILTAEPVLYYYPSGATAANEMTLAEGVTLAITGNTTKDISSGNNITIGGNSYQSLKLSNGAQNTLTLPKKAESIVFYSYVNADADATVSYWKEVNGVNYSEEDVTPMTSFKDGANPDIRVFKLEQPTKTITFNNGGKQLCYVIGVIYSDEPDAPATPAFSVESGEYDAAQTVELTCETEGAAIHYTTDGTEPTAESPLYEEPITISETTTLKAVAILDGASSDVAVAEYVISIPEPKVIYIETDLTNQFLALTEVSNWVNAIGAPVMAYAGWAAPKVTVNGVETALVESYGDGQEFKQKTGDVMYQTITGLAPGTYAIELYGAACLTAGRNGMTTDFAEGDEQALHGAYLYAQSGDQTVKTYIPCLIESDMNKRGGEEAIPTAKLEGIVVGTDGSVKVGISKELGLTNWHFVQLKSVIAQVNAFDLLATYKAQTELLLGQKMSPIVKSALETSNAIEEDDLTEENAKELLDEFGANIDAATKSIALYAQLPDMKVEAEMLLGDKMNVDVKSTLQSCYDTDIDTVAPEEQENSINAFLTAIEDARRSVGAYYHLRDQLDILKGALAGTNVYAQGNYEECQALVETNEQAYENGTITTEDADNFNIGSGTSGYLPALLLGPWSSDIENALYVNTWSWYPTEGDIPFTVPFLEYSTDSGTLTANTLTAEMGGLEPGGSYTVTALVRVQLPEDASVQGVTLQVNDGEAVAIQGDCVNAGEHLYLASYTAEGIVGDDGVLRIKFNVADDNNVKSLAFKNVWYEKTGVVIAGDADGDGTVNVNDATLAVDFAIERQTPTERQLKAANVYDPENSGITVTDVVGIVQIALGYGDEVEVLETVTAGARTMESGDDYLVLDGTEISLVNTTAFTGFQMDVTLSGGAVLAGVSATERTEGLLLTYNRTGADTWRIIALAVGGPAISAGSGAIVSLNVVGQGSAQVSRVEFADGHARAHELGVATPTAIRSLNGAAAGTEVYNLGGARLGNATRGVNVVRQADGSAKKVLVK